MKLFLMAYANAAIVAPALWIGARLWATTPLSNTGSWLRKCADHCVSYRNAWPQTEGAGDPIGKRKGSG
jgi:hypothetical protein